MILLKHVGHSLVVKENGQVRCETCSHTLDLSKSSTSNFSETPTPPRTGDVRCPMHLDSEPCRGCAANRKQARVQRTAAPDDVRAAKHLAGMRMVREAFSARNDA